MPLSNSVIRRYTPPTCTLEVLAQSSPLSRWMGKSVLKQVRFNLRFDDPRQPEDEKVVVQGDRDQLEALYTAVSGYVQEILQQSPENFWDSRIKAPSASKTPFPKSLDDVSNLEQDAANLRNQFANRGSIYLQPSSNLTHQLFLGPLGNQATGPSIQLGLLQLFDLATALDEYIADVVALPTETQPRRNSFAVPAWAPVAAVLVLGLGLMPFTYQYANRLREKNKTGETVATANKDIGNDAASKGSLTPLTVPTSLANPSPDVSQLPTLGTGLNIPNTSLPSPLASAAPNLAAPQKPSTTFPSASTQPSGSLSSIPLPPLGNNSFGNSATTKPQAGGQTLSISPNPSSARTNGGIATKPNLGANSSASLPKSRTSLPSTSLPTTSLPSLTNPSTPKAPVIPSKPANTIPQIRNNQGSLLTNLPKSSNDLAAQLRENRPASATNNAGKSSATTAAANSETLFDTNQVTQVRNYLRKRWQPPRGLKQPLQYSLTVGVDGALEQILPLTKAARDNVDRAGIPEIGQPFVSSSRNGQNVRVRAVLRPNGKVQVFPETD
ncbi:hypothetical protein Riv7116_0115 [Rivularia sp. PCC 7116]|uniref:DUF4335 domain-containing protein n=1 Tax=Rivularia sp. PCC 7116 TaxID=373994 RepID=UPI00029F281C|nr:DUF4335 domain-containing protein [Rivularia sp. PCC 7116]AFY52726.1 hypothetical protein Riv7116_0115 [Rivularia sp. PCC 7116]